MSSRTERTPDGCIEYFVTVTDRQGNDVELYMGRSLAPGRPVEQWIRVCESVGIDTQHVTDEYALYEMSYAILRALNDRKPEDLTVTERLAIRDSVAGVIPIKKKEQP